MEDRNTSIASMTKLAKDISDIVRSKSKIAFLHKTICAGAIYDGKGFIPASTSIDASIGTSWVRVCRLNKVFIRKYFRWKNETEYNRRSNRNPPFIHLFNTNYENNTNSSSDTQNAYVYLGSNINKELQLDGYHYNACDIYNSFIVDDSANMGYNSTKEESKGISYRIFKLLFIGEKNFLVGMIDKTGIMYLDHTLLQKIQTKSDELFKDTVSRIFDIYSNVNSMFFDLNITGIQNDIMERISRLLLSSINNDLKNCTIIEPEALNIFSEFNIVDNYIRRVEDRIVQETSSYLKDSYWGCNNQFSFKRIIENLLSREGEKRREEVEKAFAQGLLYGNKFELSGWSVSEFKFDDAAVVWEKEVNIVPCRAVYSHKLYNINNNDEEWHNPYKITKLYVTSNGKMYCDGKHPNVSGQNVCMGDIAGKITLSDPKKLGENLNKCEALLTLINYDSAYTSERREEILKHSTLDISNEGVLDTEYVGDGEILTDVTFEDEDDTAEVSEQEVQNDDSDVEIINEEPQNA